MNFMVRMLLVRNKLLLVVTLYNYENPGNYRPIDGSNTTQNGYPLYTNND